MKALIKITRASEGISIPVKFYRISDVQRPNVNCFKVHHNPNSKLWDVYSIRTNAFGWDVVAVNFPTYKEAKEYAIYEIEKEYM